ncbi:MAG: hypothetical protein JRH11_06245 [Deltaproteobacteria bacterium]|nr:hypothetical protein [Deltaproteobacteria bacterium]
MIKLSSCNLCSSFLPTGLSTCPNCATRIGTKARRVARPLIALTGGVLAMTLSACYGGGVETYEDSGSPQDSAMDSRADTGGGDSATGDSGSDDAATDAGDDAASDAASDASDDATPDDGGDSAP